MNWDWRFAWESLPEIAEGLIVTVEVTLISITLAMVVGLVWAVLMRSSPRVVSFAVRGVLEFIRSTPLLVQLYFVFFALPSAGLTLSPLVAGVLALGLHYSTYLAEVYRAGIDNVPKGQWEAATVLNLPQRHVWIGVILPQAIRPMIPALGNYLIAMFKETPLLAAITVVEMFNRAQTISVETFRYLEPLTIVGILFLVISYPAARSIRWLERRYAVG